MICYQKNIRRVEPAVGKPQRPTIYRMQSHSVGRSPIWPQPVAKLQFYAIAQPSVAQLPAETTDAAIWQPSIAKLAKDQRTTVGPACRAGLSSNARTAQEPTSIQRRRFVDQFTNVAVSLRRDEPFGNSRGVVWPVNFHNAFPDCGVHGASGVKERGLITAERDGYICCLNVTTLPINRPAFGRRSRHVAKSSSARRIYRTQSMPAAKTNTLRTLSP